MKTVTVLNASTLREATTALSPIRICMHVLGPARTDARVMREATALVEDGFAVSIVDIESDGGQNVEEEIQGVFLKHIIVSKSFLSTRFARWSLIKAIQILLRVTLCVMRTPADIYHAHDVSGLLPSYIAARLHRKPLIFDSHEIPLSYMSIAHARFLHVSPFFSRAFFPDVPGSLPSHIQLRRK